MNTRDIAWLAGLLEGEGSFGLIRRAGYQGTIVIRLQMTDRDVIEKAAALVGRPVGGPYGPYGRRKDGGPKKPCYAVNVTGSDAAGWMMTIFQFMGERRKERIIELLEGWKKQVVQIDGRKALCHPTEKHFAKGKCARCYNKNRYLEKRDACIALGH